MTTKKTTALFSTGLTFLVLSLLLTLSPFSFAENNEADHQFNTLRQAVSNGDTTRATEKQIKRFIKNHPKSIHTDDAHFILASLSFQRSDPKAASKWLNKLANRFPKSELTPTALVFLNNMDKFTKQLNSNEVSRKERSRQFQKIGLALMAGYTPASKKPALKKATPNQRPEQPVAHSGTHKKFVDSNTETDPERHKRMLSQLEQYERHRKTLYLKQRQGKIWGAGITQYWRRNLYPIAAGLYEELIQLYQRKPQSRHEYLSFENTYGNVARQLYFKLYGAISFPGGIDPEIKKEMEVGSSTLKRLTDDYAASYAHMDSEVEQVVKEVYAVAWDYHRAAKVARKHYPNSREYEGLPKAVADAVKDIRNTWHTHWDALPEESEPKLYAKKVIAKINRQTSYWDALQILEREEFYPKQYVPKPVQLAVENTPARIRAKIDAELAIIADDGSEPIWKQHKDRLNQTLYEFGIVKNVYQGDHKSAKRATPYKTVGEDVIKLFTSKDPDLRFLGLNAYLRYQLEYFRQECPAIALKYDKQLYLKVDDTVAFRNGKLSKFSATQIHGSDSTREKVGKYAISDAIDLLQLFQCDHISSYAHNAFHMVSNKPSRLIKRRATH